MSFIGKAVKKIFNFGKKVVKGIGRAFKNKWFRTAFMVALSVFAVGLGSGGFSGFSSAMANSGATSTIGSFFSAVGTTMATGFGAITSSVSNYFGQGAAANTGAAGTPFSGTITTATQSAGPSVVASSGSGLLSAALGQGGAAPLSSAIGAGVTNTAVTAAKTGLLAGAANLATRSMSMLASPTVGGTFMRNAVVGGISHWGKQKELEYEKRVAKRTNFYGDRARGGSADVQEGLIRSPFQQSTPASSTARQLAVDPSNPVQDSRKFMPTANPQQASPLLSKATRIKDLPSVAGMLSPQQRQQAGG